HADEHARETGAALLAARERARLTLPERLVQADAREHGLDLLAGLPAAEVLHVRGHLAVALGERLELGPLRLGHGVREALELGLERVDRGQALLDEGVHAQARLEHRALHDVTDARLALELDRALVRRLLALDQAQERGLAGAV